MKGALKAISALLLITLISAAEPEYTVLPYTIEAEDCEGAGEPWTSIYEKKLRECFLEKDLLI